MPGAHVLYVQCRPGTATADYRALLDLVGDITPIVHALPPAAVVVDVAGALRYWGTTPYDLASRMGIRAMAHLGVHVWIGAGPTRIRRVPDS